MFLESSWTGRRGGQSIVVPEMETHSLPSHRCKNSGNMAKRIRGWGFPSGVVVKNPPPNARDTGSILGSGRFPGEGNGNPLQYSCLENPMDGGAATVHGVAKSQARLSYFTYFKVQLLIALDLLEA